MLKIMTAAAMGLCKKACGFARAGECDYHKSAENYRDVEPGDCALTESEIAEMKREYGLEGKR